MSEAIKRQGPARRLGLYPLAMLLMLAGALLCACGDSGGQRQKPAAKPAPPPLNLSLFISPGVEPGQAVAVVRLFSQAARQRHLDNQAKPKDKREKLEPLALTNGPDLWTKKLVFEALPSGGGQAVQLSPAQGGQCQVVGQPKAEKLTLAHDRSYTALYRLDAPQALAPGNSLRAVLEVDGQKIISPARAVPPLAKDAQGAALRKARTARWLGDAQAMLAAGQELIKQEPESMKGYWYQGLALEKTGQDKQALASYGQAWDKWKAAQEDLKGAEPPMRLARRMARLNKKLGAKPPAPQVSR